MDWRTRGIRVVRAAQKSLDTPETLGMNRQVAISGSRTGSTALWAGTNRINRVRRPELTITAIWRA